MTQFTCVYNIHYIGYSWNKFPIKKKILLLLLAMDFYMLCPLQFHLFLIYYLQHWIVVNVKPRVFQKRGFNETEKEEKLSFSEEGGRGWRQCLGREFEGSQC